MINLALNLAALVAAAAIDLPVGDSSAWTTLAYNDIPANTISNEVGALRIAVDESASPVVYRLERPTMISGITVRASWTGALTIPAGTAQGAKGADDFVLKVGVVESGDETLNWFQRRIAPDWILALHDLAPEGSGVSRIHFLSTTRQEALLGSERLHPLSDLLYESRITHLAGPGEFLLSKEFEQPVKVLGLWLSSDGDDTGSSFDVSIDAIRLMTNGPGLQAPLQEPVSTQ